jgi:hypothetical protein
MLFTISIDCDKDGRLSMWYQRKEKLTADNEMKLQGMLQHCEKIIKSDTVRELPFKKETA